MDVKPLPLKSSRVVTEFSSRYCSRSKLQASKHACIGAVVGGQETPVPSLGLAHRMGSRLMSSIAKLLPVKDKSSSDRILLSGARSTVSSSLELKLIHSTDVMFSSALRSISVRWLPSI